MALLPSLAISLIPKFRIKLFLDQPCQLRRCSAIHLPHQTFGARTCSMKVSMADHNEPNEVQMQIRIMREKLIEAMPISVQEFPWTKAEHKLLDRLLSVARVAAKWSLVLFFVISSLSDVVYTFFINHELIIPIGLFVGCLTAEFLKETSQNLFHSSEEEGWSQHVLGMYLFFVFVKIISACCAMKARVFLLHVANGGLMQALWYGRSSGEDAKKGHEGRSTSGLEAS